VPIVAAAILPHAPILVPEIGGAERRAVPATVAALERVSAALAAAAPDVFVLAGPRHLEPVQATNALVAVSELRGDFFQFGAALELRLPVDLALTEAVVVAARDEGVPLAATPSPGYILDWGLLVPTYFATAEAGARPALALILFPWVAFETHHRLGRAVGAALAAEGRRVALVVSADLSHALKPGAPAGYDPRGADFDRRLVELVGRRDTEGLLGFDPELAEVARQDALPSAQFFAGATEGLPGRVEVLSYEGSFGVGYMVAWWQRE
jgi:aromatic ring-opening dioxygenase LigB subunit